MAAGLGFKTFNSGDVLSAADVNGYLMQGVLVFASAAARDAAITAPAEGQFAFTKDTNSLFYYDGAAWVASGATGDIEGVTAGTGISGGGTSGTVTITNSMATAIDAKGDLVVGTGADTFSRLAVGSNDQILVADSSTATGLKWAAASSGSRGLNQIIPTSVAVGSGTATVGTNGKISLSGVGTNLSVNGVFSSTYTNYVVVIDLTVASSYTALNWRLRASGTDNTDASSYKTGGLDSSIPAAASGLSSQTSNSDKFSKIMWTGVDGVNGATLTIFQPFVSSKTTFISNGFGNAAGDWYFTSCGGTHTTSASYDGFSLLTTQSLTGSVYVYGWSE